MFLFRCPIVSQLVLGSIVFAAITGLAIQTQCATLQTCSHQQVPISTKAHTNQFVTFTNATITVKYAGYRSVDEVRHYFSTQTSLDRSLTYIQDTDDNNFNTRYDVNFFTLIKCISSSSKCSTCAETPTCSWPLRSYIHFAHNFTTLEITPLSNQTHNYIKSSR